MKKIYLDYAAATPISDEVMAVMEPYFAEKFYNPSAIYLAARDVRADLNQIRHRIAQVLGGRAAEIVFTAGATEANNLAIQGVMRQFPDSELLASSLEHESVLEPGRLFDTKEIPADSSGTIILNKLSNLITDKTVLVSVMLVNNELGTIQPIREVADLLNSLRQERLAKGSKRPLYLHTDAAQAGNYLDLHVSRLGVDMMSLNGGKLYGPKQSGALFIKAGTVLKPLIVGGGQEFGLRSGTENAAAAAGFAKSLEIAQQNRHQEAKRVTGLRQSFEDELKKRIPQTVINGSKSRAPHLVSVTIPKTDNERLMMALDEAGIMCAVGSACSASHEEVSHVLSAIGLSQVAARATLRFSLGRQTTKDELEKTVAEIARLTVFNR